MAKNWKDFFANDPEWQMLKAEQTIKTKKLLSKVEFLRLVTASGFSEAAYIKYKKHFNDNAENELRLVQ